MDQMVRIDIACNCITMLFGTHTFHFNCFFEDFNCVFTQISCLSRVLLQAELHGPVNHNLLYDFAAFQLIVIRILNSWTFHIKLAKACFMNCILTLYQLVFSADNFCKQIAQRSGPT